MTEAILFGVVVLTVAALLLSKTNAGLVFLALCAGNTLLQFADKNVTYINSKLQSNYLTSKFIVSDSLLRVIIVLAPVVIILVLSKHYHGKSKRFAQIIPAIATGILGCLIIIPLLSASAQNSVASNSAWSLIQKYQIPIVAVGLLIAVVDVVQGSHSGHSKHHGKLKE
jgi:FtsH-binding integral membrane protein